MRATPRRSSVPATRQLIACTVLATALATGVLVLSTPVRSASVSHSTDKAAPTDAVNVEAEIVDQKYCGLTPEDNVVSLVLTMELKVRNATTDDIVLTRHPSAGPPIVARTVEAGEADQTETRWVSWSRYGTQEPGHLFGDRPNPADYATVGPGKLVSTRVQTSVMVRRRNTNSEPNTITEGTHHVLKVLIEWWAPFFELTDDEVSELRRRWRGSGVLITGTSLTSWIEFSAPRVDHVELCYEPAGG